MTAPRNPEFHEIAADIALKRVRFEIERFCAQQQFDPREMSRNAEMSAHFVDEMSRMMVLKLMTKIATKKFDMKGVRFPADWWESFKNRWFPRWALKRWPVQWTQVELTGSAYYPDIEIPNHQAFVEVMMTVRRNGDPVYQERRP